MNGRKPTRKQRELLTRKRLNWENWLVTKSPPGELHIISRYSNQRRVIPCPRLDRAASRERPELLDKQL